MWHLPIEEHTERRDSCAGGAICVGTLSEHFPLSVLEVVHSHFPEMPLEEDAKGYVAAGILSSSIFRRPLPRLLEPPRIAGGHPSSKSNP